MSRAPQSNTLIYIGIAAITVVAIALFFIFRAANTPTSTGAAVTQDGDVQVVKMAINGIIYEPAVITVQANKPVRWEIDATKADGCMHYLNVPQFGIRRPLSGESNVVEFTPTQKGTFRFTCSMGMGQGTLNVV